jgi:hypothetical protein
MSYIFCSRFPIILLFLLYIKVFSIESLFKYFSTSTAEYIYQNHLIFKFSISFVLYLVYCILYIVYCTLCSEGSNDKARIQKDRLLRFDRDFARRTEIIDDQSDYQMPTTWMTEEEREDAEDNQKKQLELLKRPKQTLNIGF